MTKRSVQAEALIERWAGKRLVSARHFPTMSVCSPDALGAVREAKRFSPLECPCSNPKCGAAAGNLSFTGSHQKHAISLPHRSEAVGLASLHAQTLLRWRQVQLIWNEQDRYNMLPGRNGTAVGLTSWNSSYLLTIYRYIQDQAGSHVSGPLDDQATSILATGCRHGSRRRGCRTRGSSATRLAS